MAKKKYFKKKAVLKAIGKYYRVTISKVISLVTAQNGAVALAGDSAGYNLSQLTTGTSTFQELGKQFSLVKVRGVYIECVPGSMVLGTGMLCLALQQADEENNNGVFSQPNVFTVSEQQNTKKYIKIGSTWMPTNSLNTLANLKLAYQIIQNFNVNKNWSILIKLYLTFKSSL